MTNSAYGTIGASVALMGTSSWLISMAALHPSIAALEVAIVGVRFFGIARAVFRYLERLVSHNVTFRLLGRSIKPGPEEVARNPRARSARLRAAERTDAPGARA